MEYDLAHSTTLHSTKGYASSSKLDFANEVPTAVTKIDPEVHKDGNLVNVHYAYENVQTQVESTRGKSTSGFRKQFECRICKGSSYDSR